MPEGAEAGVDGGALESEAVLHDDVDGTPKGVEAIGGVVAHHDDVGDRDLRDQVPVHGIAEHLVEAHAILVDSEPLRCSVQGDAVNPRYCRSVARPLPRASLMVALGT